MIHNSWDSFLFSRLRQTTAMQTISASGLPKREKLRNTEKRSDRSFILLSFNLTYDLKCLKCDCTSAWLLSFISVSFWGNKAE